jgi:hypothetical protein
MKPEATEETELLVRTAVASLSVGSNLFRKNTGTPMMKQEQTEETEI